MGGEFEALSRGDLMTDDNMRRIVCRHMQGAFDCFGVTDDGGHTLRFFAEVNSIAARLSPRDAAAMRDQAERILEDWFDAMQQVLSETRNASSDTQQPHHRSATPRNVDRTRLRTQVSKTVSALFWLFR